MIIGHPGGFILTNPPYYLLTTNALLKDTTQYLSAIPGSISSFHFNITEPGAKFDSVKDLLNTIPAELFNENHASIGKLFPDVGYEYIQASINGVLYQWNFLPDQSSSSPEIQQFVSKLNSNF